jgi:integrase
MRLTDARVEAIRPPAQGQEEHPDEIVTGLRLRVGAGGRKSWIVRVRAGSKVLNRTIGVYPVLRVTAAREQARAFLEKLDKTGGKEAPRRTLQDLVDLWIKRVAQPGNSSWKNQQRRLEIHVLPTLGDRALESITRADIRDLIDGIEGKVAPNQALAILRTVLRFGVARDWLEASPAEALRKPHEERPRDRFLTMDEVARVWHSADLLGYPFGGFVRLLLLTGQRRSEVAQLRWGDLNLQDRTWTIASEDNKSRRAHLVPLSPAAAELLKTLPALGDFVFTTDGETPISGFAKAKQRLDTFLGAKGPALDRWTFHDLRRTVSTNMQRLGIGESIIGRVLNHAPQGVTQRVYALYAFEAEKRSALGLWATEISRATNAPVGS